MKKLSKRLADKWEKIELTILDGVSEKTKRRFYKKFPNYVLDEVDAPTVLKLLKSPPDYYVWYDTDTVAFFYGTKEKIESDLDKFLKRIK